MPETHLFYVVTPVTLMVKNDYNSFKKKKELVITIQASMYLESSLMALVVPALPGLEVHYSDISLADNGTPNWGPVPNRLSG